MALSVVKITAQVGEASVYVEATLVADAVTALNDLKAQISPASSEQTVVTPPTDVPVTV